MKNDNATLEIHVHGDVPIKPGTDIKAIQEATDFKSGVSTDFTTGAETLLCLDKPDLPGQSICKFCMANTKNVTTLK